MHQNGGTRQLLGIFQPCCTLMAELAENAVTPCGLVKTWYRKSTTTPLPRRLSGFTKPANDDTVLCYCPWVWFRKTQVKTSDFSTERKLHLSQAKDWLISEIKDGQQDVVRRLFAGGFFLEYLGKFFGLEFWWDLWILVYGSWYFVHICCLCTSLYVLMFLSQWLFFSLYLMFSFRYFTAVWREFKSSVVHCCLPVFICWLLHFSC